MGEAIMAKCEHCGKTPQFGHRRSHSLKATNRQFKVNIQTTTVMENDRPVRKKLCGKCVKTLGKAA
jgi:large subunit ribosomal protein L28